MRYVARRLPRDFGAAGWNALLPARQSNPDLDQDITADVVVVGAGFAGLSAAIRLHQNDPSLRVVILEATEIGDGPVGRNSGFMIDLPHDLASSNYAGATDDVSIIKLNRYAIEFARTVSAEGEFSPEAYNQCGKINGAATSNGDIHNRAYAEHLENLGERCEFLDKTQMKEVTGSDYYVSGLYTPGTVLLQPALWARSLASLLSRNASFRLFENSPVTLLERKGIDWLVRTVTGSVTAKKVIMATNGHVESFGLFQRRLVHVMLYASMTPVLNDEQLNRLGGQENWGVTPSDPMGTTVRRFEAAGGSRLIIRNQISYTPTMEVTDQTLKRLSSRHGKALVARFPSMRGVGFEYSWAGRLCLSLNDAPAFGEVEENLYVASCQNGLGATRGTLSGLLAGDLALDVKSDELDYWNAQPEPQKLPPEPMATLGATATLAWRQFRAGREV